MMKPITSPFEFYGKHAYKAVVHFKDECPMVHVRAHKITERLKELSDEVYHFPFQLTDQSENVDIIRKEGFKLVFASERDLTDIRHHLERTSHIERLLLERLEGPFEQEGQAKEKAHAYASSNQEERGEFE